MNETPPNLPIVKGPTFEPSDEAPYCEIPAFFFDRMLKLLNKPYCQGEETEILEVGRYNLPNC